MKKLIITSTVAIAIASMSMSISAQKISRGAVANPPVNQQFEAVSYSFPVVESAVMDFSQKQSFSQSREYYMDVTGSQLQKGVGLKTSAKGALVRISAFDGKEAVEPQDLSISNASLKMEKGSGFDMLVDSTQMKNTGMGFQKGTSGFRIAEKMGKGQLTLKSNRSMNPNARYRVNVFEKNSDTELHLTAAKNAYLKSDTLKVNAQVFDKGSNQKITAISGQLIAPDGQASMVTFAKGKDGYQVKMPLTMSSNYRPGVLWTIETQVDVEVDGLMVKRTGRVPFAYADSTAKLMGHQQQIVKANTGQLSAPVSVQAKKDGRYEVRAVLYATNKQGDMVPAMVTHSAAYMGAGLGYINMDFDSAILAKTGLQAPYQLRNLQLRDQGQMAVLETR